MRDRESKLILLKSQKAQLSANLNSTELKCKCAYQHCKITPVDLFLVECFQRLRQKSNQPLRISSGYRCTHHNFDIGGSQRSRHQIGDAVDILCPSEFETSYFRQMALDAGFTSVYTYDNPRRIHADIR